MILAGIDEAGYGPLLGPLVVGCCAFEVEARDGEPCAPEDGQLPCLWRRLNRLVSRHRTKSGKKIHINDSKVVYSPAVGLKELERSLLAIVACGENWPEHFNALLARVAPQAVGELDEYPWYQPSAGECFPLEQDGMPIRLFGNALRQEMQRSGARCVHLEAQVVCERRLNRMFDATRNKASTLFSIAATHIDTLLRRYADRGLVIFCDRQGGRGHYGGLLRLMFEDWALEVTREDEGHSEYLLKPVSAGGLARDVRIIFAEKAESRCMSVALASMLSKYLREALMKRFNAWWLSHLPQVAPTAGYYSDGMRFLQEIESKRRELGIAQEHLVRSR